MTDISTGKLKRADLPQATQQLMQGLCGLGNDRTFVGANSHISFEELSSHAGNESISGRMPPGSVMSASNFVDNSRDVFENNRKVDEMLAARQARP